MSASERARSGRWGRGWEPAKPHQKGKFLTFPTFRTWFYALAQACVCTRMHPQACARVCAPLPHSTFGRFGRFGRRPCHKVSQLPNLFRTSERLGTP